MNNILDNNIFMLSFSLKDLCYCPPSAGLKKKKVITDQTISVKIKSTLFLQFDFMSTKDSRVQSQVQQCRSEVPKQTERWRGRLSELKHNSEAERCQEIPDEKFPLSITDKRQTFPGFQRLCQRGLGQIWTPVSLQRLSWGCAADWAAWIVASPKFLF